ncbi:MAG: TraR/DksA C4-type zinc finger protein [Gallionellaceae bacterium]|nr:TraR/DksA C4-type zinc finger protein [Gallionellaceae bacterium]
MTPEDRAQALELAEYERNQAKAIMQKPTRPSAKLCECGERIPAARRKAVPGVQTCIECQALNEKMKGRQ